MQNKKTNTLRATKNHCLTVKNKLKKKIFSQITLKCNKNTFKISVNLNQFLALMLVITLYFTSFI